MKKISLFIPNFSSSIKSGIDALARGMDFDYGDLIKNKTEAIKAITFLMTEWKISMQDFVSEYNKKRKKGKK